MSIKAAAILGCVLAGLLGVGQIMAGEPTRPYPTLVTVQTRADPQVLAALQRPGKVFFRDDFESPDSAKRGVDDILRKPIIMNRPRTVLPIWVAAVWALLWAAADGPAAEEGSRTWLGTWRKDNPQWRALHLIGPQPQRLDVTKELVTTLMVPNRMNVLVLEVDYRVLPCPWKNPDAAVALVRCARKDAADKMLGALFTGWSAGGSGEHLLHAWTDRAVQEKPPAKTQETARGIAAAIGAGLKELDR
jgi:hypothetical protein